jgi:hypothetical protein
MSQAKKDQVVDILANGLMNFVNVTGDKEMMKLATIVLRDVSDVFVAHIKADDICTFAFPSMTIPPDSQAECFVECFVAILNDRVIVAWRRGFFKKKTVILVIGKHTIKQASWAVVNRPGVTRGDAVLLTIIADETIDIALPKDKPAVANAILLAVQAR